MPPFKTEKPRLRLSMPVNHAETPFRVLSLSGHLEKWEANCNVKDILASLHEIQLITSVERSTIRDLPTNLARFQQLLTILNSRTGPGTVEAFLKCLVQEGYSHTSSMMSEYLNELYNTANSDSARSVCLKSGLVPSQPDIYVVRENLIYSTKDEIIKACQKAKQAQSTCCVLIHGMAGNGKSYLAAAAMRSPEIWKMCFDSGVFWIDIGKPGKEKLLIKLASLLQMVDSAGQGPSMTPPAEIDMVLPKLAQAFASKYPNSALVLDDVWDAEVLKAFGKVPCRCVIITSRKADIAKVLPWSVTAIEVNKGFTESESQQYFSQSLSKTVTELPKEALLIHEKCTGSPMMISLIGGLLRDNPNRWKHYLDKLTDVPHNVMEMPHNLIEDQKSIDEIIALSVENLKDDLRQKFFDFAIFDDGVPIPEQVFRVLWSVQTVEDVQDEMAYFVNSSLCTRELCPQRGFLYKFHDLILAYARKHIPISPQTSASDEETARERSVEDRHRKLFLKYQTLGAGKLEFLEDDFYIHSFIGYHLSQGKLMADIQSIYKNKEFLEQRLKFVGPEVVLVDVNLLKKQHPFLKPKLIWIEEFIKLKYAITMNSPDVQTNRRSLLVPDHILSSRRASESELLMPSLPTSVIPPDNEELENAHNGLHQSHSVPAELNSELSVFEDIVQEKSKVPAVRPKSFMQKLNIKNLRCDSAIEDD